MYKISESKNIFENQKFKVVFKFPGLTLIISFLSNN